MTYFSFSAIPPASYIGVLRQLSLWRWRLGVLAVSIQCPRTLCPFSSLDLLLSYQGRCTFTLPGSRQLMTWNKVAVHLLDEHFDFFFTGTLGRFRQTWSFLATRFWIGDQLIFNLFDPGLGINPEIPGTMCLGFWEASAGLTAILRA